MPNATAGRVGNAQTQDQNAETTVFIANYQPPVFAQSSGALTLTSGGNQATNHGDPLWAAHLQCDTGSAVGALFRVEPKCAGSSSTNQVLLAPGESWEPSRGPGEPPIYKIFLKGNGGTATASWRPL